MTMQLAPLTELQRQMVQAAQDLDAPTLKDMNDTITTLEEHARKVKDNTGKIRQLTALRIWNLYHLGQVLNEICPHGGARPQAGVLHTLARYGIDWRLSVRARKIAGIHTEDIRTFIEESGDEINLSHLLKLDTEENTDPPEWDEDANWRMLRSVVRDFFERAHDEERLHKCAEFLEE